MRKWAGILMVLWICLFQISACGAFEIGIEHVPSASTSDAINWQATAETLQAAATQLSNEMQLVSPLMAVEITPTPITPPPTPTPSPTALTNVLPTPIPTATAPVGSFDSEDRYVWIAYAQRGDIWVKAFINGRPQRLTEDGTNYAPRLSPSGKMIAYLKDPSFPNLVVSQREGTGVTFYGGPVEQFDWSPVDDRIAYRVGGQLWISGQPIATPIPPDSENDTTQPDTTQSGIPPMIGQFAWSPNGQRIAFTRSEPPGGLVLEEGLWVVDVFGGEPLQLFEIKVQERREIITLHGWSGDGKYLLYWQVPIDSMRSDGMGGAPLYAISVDGGEPLLLVDAVPVYDDAVQVEPGGEQVAVIRGAERAQWTDKKLLMLSIPDVTQKFQLSPLDQSATSPVWLPNTGKIAYVGMPDATTAVTEGAGASAALQQRRIWLLDMQTLARNSISDANGTLPSDYRDEAPRWLVNNMLLFARLDRDGKASLWSVDVNGDGLYQVVEEISPEPQGSVNYGHIDWRNYFALWTPAIADVKAAIAASQPVPTNSTLALTDFLSQLEPDLTIEDATEIWGEPESSVSLWEPDPTAPTDPSKGNLLSALRYPLVDGLKISLGFPNHRPLTYVQLQSSNGRTFVLTSLDESWDQALVPVAGTPQPTPPFLFGTITPTSTPMQIQSPLATPTPPIPLTPTP